MELKRRRLVMYGLFAIVLAIMPFLFGRFTANEILVFAIFAMAYNLLLGFGGELSFGHAAFFGFGAYATVMGAQHLSQNLYLMMIFAVVLTGLMSIPFAYISLQRRGIYLALITLALAMMFYYAAFRGGEYTGGSDGMFLPIYDAGIGPIDPLAGGIEFYIFGIVVFALVYFLIRRITRSPFGRALQAVRESEERARHLGYDSQRLLLIAFVMSGTLSGLAGSMYAVLFAFVGPGSLFWIVSGEVILVLLIGGVATLFGPFVGAVIFVSLANNLTQYTAHWPVIFGAIFVVIVMFAPQGLVGLYEDYQEGKIALEDIRPKKLLEKGEFE